MARSQAEFKLHCVIADYLRAAMPKRLLWWHTANGEARSAATGARLKRMGVQRGMPDLFVFHDGELIAIEIKADKGRLSPEQADVADRLVALGAHYILARSLDDVEIGLRNRGVPLLATAARAVPLIGRVANAAFRA